MLIYVAGPYSGPTDAAITANIDSARHVAIKLWEMGHAVICPHLNTAHFERDCNCDYEDYLRGDFAMIARCDAMVMAPGAVHSLGSMREMEYAESLGIPVYQYYALPKLHPTEVKSPIQVKAFGEEIGKMHRLHLSKNADYSSANVAGPGQPGLSTRIWDKCTRLMNLTGFNVFVKTNDHPRTLWQKLLYFIQGRVVVIDEIIYTEPRVPKHESIEDTLSDNAVYSIITKLWREGKWGK